MKYFYTLGILGEILDQVGRDEYEFEALNGAWNGYINFETNEICSVRCSEWRVFKDIWRGDDLVGSDYNAQIEHIKKLMETD